MEYIMGALAILFLPFFIGSMLLVAFWEKDTEEVQRQEKPREQAEQSRTPIREVEKEPSPVPRVMGSGMTEGGGYSTGNQQTAKTHGDDERRKRKKRRR
jgi:hypothetical protein